jgi:hypothetical protein
VILPACNSFRFIQRKKAGEKSPAFFVCADDNIF